MKYSIPDLTYQMPPLNEALIREVLYSILKNDSNVSAIINKINEKRNRERREVFALKMLKKRRLSSKKIICYNVWIDLDIKKTATL